MPRIRRNGFYNDPNVGQAFDNLAQIFAPPSATDIYAGVKAQAERERASRLSEMFNNPNHPDFDKRGVALNLYAPTQSYEALRLGDATARRGQDVSAATSRANNQADNQRQVVTTMYGPLKANELRPEIPKSVADLYSIPTAPEARGVMSAGQGDTLFLPNGERLSGSPKPLTDEQVKGAILSGLPAADQRNAALSSVPVETVVGPDNQPRIVNRTDAVGQRPYVKAGDTEPVEQVVGPDGATRYVTRSQAVGQRVPDKPLTESEFKAREADRLQRQGVLSDTEMKAIITGGAPTTIVAGPDGPQIAYTSQAIGKTPAGSRPMTTEERAAFGVPSNVGAAIGPDGKPSVLGGQGTSVNIDQRAESALASALGGKTGEQWARYLAAGNTAANMRADLDVLDELSAIAPQGPIVGRLVQAFPGVSSAGAAFQSVVNRVAPAFHVPGSGATSDLEYGGMLRSLPALQNYPDANRAIAETIRAKSALDAQRADVVRMFQNKRITQEEANDRLAVIDQTSVMTPRLKILLANLGPGAGAGGGGADREQAPQANATGPSRRTLNGKTYERDSAGNWFEVQ